MDFWVAMLVPLIVPGALGLIGFGVLKNRIDTTFRALDDKADRDVVKVQYDSILTRLDRIERKLDANHR